MKSLCINAMKSGTSNVFNFYLKGRRNLKRFLSCKPGRIALYQAIFSRGGGSTLLAGSLICAVILTTVWHFTYVRITDERTQAIENSITESNDISMVLASYLDEALETALAYSEIGSEFMKGDHRAVANLDSIFIGESVYMRAAIFDESNQLLYSSSRDDREVLFHDLIGKQKLKFKGLVSGYAVDDKEESLGMPLVISLFDKKNQLVGYFCVFFDLDYFLRPYIGISKNAGLNINILHKDGSILAMLNAGNIFSIDKMSSQKDFLDTENSNIVQVHDSAENSGVVRKSGKYPFFISVSRPKNSITKNMEKYQSRYILQALQASGSILLVALMMYIFLLKKKFLNAKLEYSEREKNTLIEQLREEKVLAYKMASHDYLTGVPNRMLFYEISEAQLLHAKRSRNHYAILFMDLNKFKLVNDTLGHLIGDELLKSVAARLRAALREYDLIARFGGDEFVILLTEMQSENDVARVAAAIIKAINMPFPDIGGQEIMISTSIGIALYPRDGQNVDALLSNADAAMYSAKRAGGGIFHFYDASLNRTTARGLELLTRFRRAIKDDEFCFHYQPKFDTKDLKITGVEALIRWQHPEHGLIFPDEFIPILEESDLIVALGYWTFEAACRQLMAWKKAGVAVVPISVNVSTKQLCDELFIEKIFSEMQKHDVIPELIELEVTESCFISDFPQAVEVLNELGRRGIAISLDDYGTGYAGLSHVKKLPISSLKIDRSFIRDIAIDNDDMMIVSSTIALARDLGLRVVAEGVESEDQLKRLRDLGCGQVQGYYLMRPVPPDKIQAVLMQGVLSA